MNKKFEPRKESEAERAYDPGNQKSKEQRIRESAMPEYQKEACLREIGVIVDKAPEGVPFSVYAKAKKIKTSLIKAMEVYPKAKAVSLATMSEWDEIFKKF